MMVGWWNRPIDVGIYREQLPEHHRDRGCHPLPGPFHLSVAIAEDTYVRAYGTGLALNNLLERGMVHSRSETRSHHPFATHT